MIQDPAWLILLSSGETNAETNPQTLLSFSLIHHMCRLDDPLNWFPLFIPPFHVPAAESIPEGMQSGQLLQTSAPAAGEGTGEQQLHHRAQTEGFLRRGQCHRCGECLVRMRVWEKGKRREGYLSLFLQIANLVSSFYFYIFDSLTLRVWTLKSSNAVMCI